MSDFIIEEYVAPVKVNEYRDKVVQLKDASDTAGKQLVGKFTVPTAKVGPARRLISEAARELDRTASYVGDAKSEDGETVTLSVLLAPKRKVKTADEQPADEQPTADNETETTDAPKPRGGRRTAE